MNPYEADWPDHGPHYMPCDGCGQLGHPWSGSHRTCTRCIRALDGPEVGPQAVACMSCIVEVVVWAGQLTAAADESYLAAVRERLSRLKEGKL
jgi:hypothetical protein